MELSHLLPPVIGGFGLYAAKYVYDLVKQYPEGEGAVVRIAEQIHMGCDGIHAT